MTTAPRFACPCCGYFTLSEKPPGTYEICLVCGWEDDPVQFVNADYRGGANHGSLNECRKAFEANKPAAAVLERYSRPAPS